MAGGKLGGTFLKLTQTILYALLFCCAAVILGIYSYFLSVLADRNAPIPTWSKAVEGISGAAVLYLILAVILTCCLGGKVIFAFIAIVLDILFCGAFIGIAILTRHGAGSCSGNVRTPLGNGPSNSKQGWEGGDGDQVTYAASLGTICRLNTAVFAVSLIGAFLFAVSAIVQLCLGRHHQKEKRFGPSPRNNYTRGSGGKFWQRKQKNQALRDPEMVGAVPATSTHTHGTHSHDGGIRPSHDTAYTGSTVGGTGAYENTHKPLAGGYHTAPTGTYNTNTSNTTTGYYNNPTPATNY